MKNILFLFVLFAMFSCGNIQRVDTTKIKVLMDSHKIKKFNDSDILSEIDILGNKLIEKAKTESNCVNSNFELISLNENAAKFKGKTKDIIEAYQYSLKNNEKIDINTQKINDTTYLFTFPIDQKSELYLKCKKEIGMKYFYKSFVLRSIK